MFVPAAEHHHARARGGLVDDDVDVPENDEIELQRIGIGIPAESREMPRVASGAARVVRLSEGDVKPVRGGRRQHPKRAEERPALEPPFPVRPRSEPVPVDQPQSQAFHLHIKGFVDHAGVQDPFVERAEPRVVITDQDDEGASPRSELSECAEARASHWIAISLSRSEPEVAEIADDGQRIVGGEAIDEARESSRAFGAVEPEMNVTGEIGRHGGMNLGEND